MISVIVVGSGVAGLQKAQRARALRHRLDVGGRNVSRRARGQGLRHCARGQGLRQRERTTGRWNGTAQGVASTQDCKPGSACQCDGIRGLQSKVCRKRLQVYVRWRWLRKFVDCPEGKCTAESNGTGATTLSCAGGDCRLKCSGTGACTISQCKSGCSTKCNGIGTWQLREWLLSCEPRLVAPRAVSPRTTRAYKSNRPWPKCVLCVW